MGDDNAAVKLDPRLHFFAGTVAGMAAIAVGFPFDTIKVRLQSAANNGRYKSTFHALSTILREERVSGLYRGVASPLITAAPLNGLVFSVYRFLMKLQLEDATDVPTLTQVTLAGAGTGAVGTLISTPTELVKTQQQLMQSAAASSSCSKPPVSARDVASYVFKHHGVKGFYRGVTATALRDSGYGTYFAAYEATIRYWPRSLDATETNSSTTASWPALLCAGGMAGIAGWVVTFPFDVVKTRVQSTFATTPDHPYRNTLSTIVASYRAEGLSVFFRGLAPTLIRAIPVNMVTFTTFEAIVHAFS